MTNRKKQRLYFVLLTLACFGVAVGLVLFNFNDSLVFFHSPTEVMEKKIKPNVNFRLGGMVEDGSVLKGNDPLDVTFVVTDFEHSMTVHYKGILPDLFREGQGVVAEGYLTEEMSFQAKTILAKHDENYMPPEVARSLKKDHKERQS